MESSDQLHPQDWRRTNPRFQSGNFEYNRTLVEQLAAIADDRGLTPAQVALSWVSSRGDNVVAIPGTSRPSRVDENVIAARVELTATELARLDEIFPPGAAAGQRYPDEYMRLIDGHGERSTT